MIDIEVSSYSKDLYKFKLISDFESEEVYFLNQKDLKEVQQQLKDALWLISKFVKEEE